jgi:hypothetical protein
MGFIVTQLAGRGPGAVVTRWLITAAAKAGKQESDAALSVEAKPTADEWFKKCGQSGQEDGIGCIFYSFARFLNAL